MSEEIRIRENWGPMPFDRDGRHATGREVLVFWKPTNQFIWKPEFDGDTTCELPTTDPDYYPEADGTQLSKRKARKSVEEMLSAFSPEEWRQMIEEEMDQLGLYFSEAESYEHVPLFDNRYEY